MAGIFCLRRGQWTPVKEIVGLAGWADDLALEDVAGGISAHDQIDDELGRWSSTAGSQELAERLVAGGMSAAAVAAPAAVTENPQLLARQFFEAVEQPVVGPYTFPALAFQVRGLPGRWLRSAPPTLGQHNFEVLQGWLA